MAFSPSLSPPVCNPRFVNVLVYYGLSLGVSRLGTDLYLTQFVFGLVEIPARTLVLLVLPFSRRFSQSCFLAVGGLACLLMLAIPAGEMDTVTGTFCNIETLTSVSPHILMLRYIFITFNFPVFVCRPS